MRALGTSRAWPVEHGAVAVLHGGALVARDGSLEQRFAWASITKLLTAWATLIAVEEGATTLDDPVGADDCTLRHLLAHAGGYGFDSPGPVSAPGRSRMYSNTGYEVLAEHVAMVTGMPFETYLVEAVLAPLDMTHCRLEGSPAKGAVGTLDDLVAFARELVHPALVHEDTAALATSVAFADLSGIVPAVGRFTPCPWGLGPEIKGSKTPHWTGTLTSASTYGHFGGSGTFVWIDPQIEVACLALTDRPMPEWGMAHWPGFSDQVVAELLGTPS